MNWASHVDEWKYRRVWKWKASPSPQYDHTWILVNYLYLFVKTCSQCEESAPYTFTQFILLTNYIGYNLVKTSNWFS